MHWILGVIVLEIHCLDNPVPVIILFEGVRRHRGHLHDISTILPESVGALVGDI